MAASGFTEEGREDSLEDFEAKDGFDLIGMMHKNGIFNRSYQFEPNNNNVCVGAHGTTLAKCLGRLAASSLNGAVKPALDTLLKSSALSVRSRATTQEDNNNNAFHTERRGMRFDRAASTDSVAASSGGSDSCQSSYSSSSDTTSVSEPCSPESIDSPGPATPQPMPPLPPSLVDSEDSSSLIPPPRSPEPLFKLQDHGVVTTTPIFTLKTADPYLAVDKENDRPPPLPQLLELQKIFSSERNVQSEQPLAASAAVSVEDLASPDQQVESEIEDRKVTSFTTSKLSEDRTDVTEHQLSPQSGDASRSSSCTPPPPLVAFDGLPDVGKNVEACQTSERLQPLASVALDEDDVDLECWSVVQKCVNFAADSVDDQQRVRTVETIVSVDDVTTQTERSSLAGHLVTSENSITSKSLSDLKSFLAPCSSSNQVQQSPLCINNNRTAVAFSGNCVRTQSQDSQSVAVHCKWFQCHATLQCEEEIVNHIRITHVDTQTDQENFVCLWEGCKVYDRPSSSRSWLERHLISHGGGKPFGCIVDGCGQRFTSQVALERHVNSHFNPTPAPSKPARAKDDSPLKLLKKKKLRCRRRGWPGKIEDFFDASIMEQLRHKLAETNSNPILEIGECGNSVTVYGSVLARRKENGGKVKVLMHWVPEDILPDRWVLESEAWELSEQVVPLASLPRSMLEALDSSSSSTSVTPHRRKRK